MTTGDMKEKRITILDFDQAVHLARTDPDGFERYRRHVIEALIARAPERNREHLRRLQWRIDQERERASNPIAACLKLYRMMMDAYAGEHGLLDTLNNAHRSRRNTRNLRHKAEVLPFASPLASKHHSET